MKSFLSEVLICLKKERLKFLLAGCFLFITLIHLPALTLYGDAESRVDLSFPEEHGDDRYESLVNPGNTMGLNDLMYSMDLTMKMEEFTDTGNFDFWVSLEGTTSDAGERAFLLDVMRLSYNWIMTDSIRLSIGRQGFLTGYGYGWNPMDLFNPLKNPSDPDQDLVGVDAVSLLLDNGGSVQLQGILLVTDEEGDHVAYEDLRAGLTATFLLPFAELKFSGLGGRESAVGGGFLADIAGAGFYGEAAVREKSRTALPGGGPDYNLEQTDGPVYSGLVGLEYVFASELSLTMEYFYNGEGLDQTDRENYQEALDGYTKADGAASEEYYELYNPGYFAQHYLLLRAFYPLYSLLSELNFMIIASPDSGSLAVQPEWVVLPSGNFEVSVGWSGLYSLDDSRWGEARLAPVNNAAYLEAVYHF